LFIAYVANQRNFRTRASSLLTEGVEAEAEARHKSQGVQAELVKEMVASDELDANVYGFRTRGFPF